MDNKVNVKDLINTGVFTAIYFVLFFICGMLGYIPIFVVLLTFMVPVLTGIPFILFLTKVNKFGMVTIMGTILGLLMFAMGQGWLSIVFGSGCGLIADLIFKSGGYKSWKKTLIGYCVFSQWVIGTMLPMWIMRDSFFEQVRAGYGNEYADAVMGLMTNWMIGALVVLGLIGGIIGAYLGRRALKKHFMRAGIV